ncbi:MAG: hypothetical protein ACFHWZ_15240 [Phycisphaerales bacterium]
MAHQPKLQPIPGWPKVRVIANRGYRVSGRALTPFMWLLLTRIGVLSATTFGLCQLLAATVDLWGPSVADVAEGSQVYRALRVIVSYRGLVASLFERFPEVGYNPSWPIDPYLGGLGVAIIWLTHPLARLFTFVVSLALRPLVMRRFVLAITDDRVRIRGRVFSTTLARNDNGLNAVRFRKVELSHRASGGPFLKDAPALAQLAIRRSATVELVHGMRRRKVITTRADKAEAIVAACNEALVRTHRPLPI